MVIGRLRKISKTELILFVYCEEYMKQMLCRLFDGEKRKKPIARADYGTASIKISENDPNSTDGVEVGSRAVLNLESNLKSTVRDETTPYI